MTIFEVLKGHTVELKQADDCFKFTVLVDGEDISDFCEEMNITIRGGMPPKIELTMDRNICNMKLSNSEILPSFTKYLNNHANP